MPTDYTQLTDQELTVELGNAVDTIRKNELESLRKERAMEIKPCPFCGILASEANDHQADTKVVTLPRNEDHPQLYYVVCGYARCFARGPYSANSNRAIAAWNTVSDAVHNKEKQ